MFPIGRIIYALLGYDAPLQNAVIYLMTFGNLL
jgi:hypothetical protein